MPYKRPGSRYWQIRVGGVRQSTETEDEETAARIERERNDLIRLDRQKRQIDALRAEVAGVKPARSWKELCVQWAKEKKAKASWPDDLRMIEWWGRFLDRETDVRRITRERVDEIMRNNRPVSVVLELPANSTANRYVALLSGMLNAA